MAEKKESGITIYLIMGVIIIVLLGLNVIQFTKKVGRAVDGKEMISVEAADESKAAALRQSNSDWEKYVKEYEKVCNESIAKAKKGKPVTAPTSLTVAPPTKDFFGDEEVDDAAMEAHKKRMQEMLNDISKPVMEAQAKTQEETK